MKRGKILLFFLVGLFLINFASATYYGSLSLSDLLNEIDASTIFLGAIFIISFAFINSSLVRVFRDNKTASTVISLTISLGVIYAINLTGLDFQGFFYNIGLSTGFLTTIASLILIGGGIYLTFRFGFATMLIVLGGFFLILSSTNFIYETGTTIVIGIILIGIGFWLRKKKHSLVGPNYSDYGIPSKSSRPNSREIYKQELIDRRYQEKVRQAQIRARVKNIQKIRRVREKRDKAREQRRRNI